MREESGSDNRASGQGLRADRLDHYDNRMERINDPQAFRDFLDSRLSRGGGGLTLDECLGLWEHENLADEERVATVQAVREALEDMRAGDTGIPANDAIAELRRKYGLPDRP